MTTTASPHKRPRKRRRMFWMLLACLLVFGGLFAVQAMMNRGMNAFFDTMPQPAAAVTTWKAKSERWSDVLEAVGTLVAVNGAEVTTESGGVVRSLEFEAGQPVEAGAVLLRLNAANEQATLQALEAAARLAAVQRDRWRQLGKTQLVSQDEVQQRVTAAATAQAQVEAQRALIAQKTIRAPFSGVLGIRQVNLGQFIAPGSPIVSLQQLDPIHLDFTLPEQHIGQIREGLAIEAETDAMPGQRFAGKVTAIEPRIDPATRNFKVQATLRNPDHRLRPGAFARVRFELGGAREVIVVPQTAISFNPYGNAVFVVSRVARGKGEKDMQGKPLSGDKTIVTQRFIQTGAARGDLIAVTSGLKPGEEVATSGLLKLRNDAEVTIHNQVQPAADARPQVRNR